MKKKPWKLLAKSLIPLNEAGTKNRGFFGDFLGRD
jgi:hypothetical protein